MVQDIDIADSINDDEVIWRYMDFASFYSLLHAKGLFFRRLDRYSDEYEGTLPDEVKEFLVKHFASTPFFTQASAIESTNRFIAHLKELNTGTLSNSWVANPKESYAMWKIYLRGSQEGVAIRTTVGKLREVLNGSTTQFTLAKVSYEILPWPLTDYTTLAAYKSKPYSYECELRVLVYNQFENDSIPTDVFPKVPLHEHGATFQVDLEKLIEEIYISPFAGAWFEAVVRATTHTLLPSLDCKQIVSSRIKDK